MFHPYKGGDPNDIRSAGSKKPTKVLFHCVLGVLTNQVPQFTDNAFKGRLRPYHFCNKFKRDDSITQWMKDNKHYFFTLICKYAKMFYDNGRILNTCDEIVNYTTKIIQEKDTLNTWIQNERFEKTNDKKDYINNITIFDDYKNACIDNKWKALGKIEFYKKFQEALELDDSVQIKYKEEGIDRTIRGYRFLKRVQSEEEKE